MAVFNLFCCAERFAWKDSNWRRFSLSELYAATNRLNYDNMIGEGAFGSLYWGQLSDGSQIALKRLKLQKPETEFETEVKMLAKIRHKNLLSLRGYCIEAQERILVYDYMPNFSLHYHLHDPYSTDSHLDWTDRMNVAIGAAKGIAYLHHNKHMIHGNIKASNVLLDLNLQPKVTDFEYVKLSIDEATYTATRAKGNVGYLDPEYNPSPKDSKSCDVYSFGVLLLELVSGKPPILKVNNHNTTTKQLITEWALPLVCENRFSEIADPKLNGKFVEEELKRIVYVGLMCAHFQPGKRPNMLEVVELLKGESKYKLSQIENEGLFACAKPVTEDSLDLNSEKENSEQDLKPKWDKNG